MALGKYPEFAWSVSRGNLFEFCPRKFYYRYYGMWGGWDQRAPEKTQQLYLLCKRTSLAAWAGQEVHRAVALYLDDDRAEMQSVITATRERMRQQFRLSRSLAFRQPRRAKTFGLLEHHYEEDLADDVVRSAWERVEQGLLAFAAADYKEAVLSARQAGRICYVESPEEPDFDAIKIRLPEVGEFPIFAAPDFIIEREGGAIELLDWKTGALPSGVDEGRVSTQVAFYRSWIDQNLSLSDDQRARLEGYEIYLPSRQSFGGRVTDEHVHGAIRFAQQSVATIRSKVADVEINRAEEQDFECAGTASKCAKCEFRALCDGRVVE